MPPPSSRLMIDAVITAASTVGRPVGDGQAPNPTSFPYAVVYSLPAVERGGPWNDNQADEWTAVQVTYVGETREQAQWLADQIRPVLMDPSNIVVAGRRVQTSDLIDGSGVERDDDPPEGPLFYAVDVFAIFTS